MPEDKVKKDLCDSQNRKGLYTLAKAIDSPRFPSISQAGSPRSAMNKRAFGKLRQRSRSLVELAETSSVTAQATEPLAG
jgi:hypothetical protein